MPFETITPDDLNALVKLQDDMIEHWHDNPITLPQDTWLKSVVGNHSENYQLWHQEDKARREDMGFEYVYKAKRAIDAHNQKRNNLMEAMDIFLFDHYKLLSQSHLPMHSETPGMMIDRLSILALKIYHMGLQTKRKDASDEHKAMCLEKWQILKIQRDDLKQCLQNLLADLKNQSKTFKLYKQMKMYNEKSLNPQLYGNPKE